MSVTYGELQPFRPFLSPKAAHRFLNDALIAFECDRKRLSLAEAAESAENVETDKDTRFRTNKEFKGFLCVLCASSERSERARDKGF